MRSLSTVESSVLIDCLGNTGEIDPFKYVADVVSNKTSQYRNCPDGMRIHGQPYPNIKDSIDNNLDLRGVQTQWKIPTQAASARLPIFPEEHIQAHLQGIQSCKTASLNVLVDSLYQELKKVKVKKNCIERKVREIAEKRMDSDAGIKIWTIKMEYLQPGIAAV